MQRERERKTKCLHWLVELMHQLISSLDAVNGEDSDSLRNLYLVMCLVKCVALASVRLILDFPTFAPYCVVAIMSPTIGDALNASICPYEHQSHGNDSVELNPVPDTHLRPSTNNKNRKKTHTTFEINM